MAEAREQIESRLTDLHRQRGAAVLDGQKFDSGAIAATEAELHALADAEGERSRRQRAAAEAEHLKEIGALRVQLSALRQNYLQDAKEAEAHARGEAAALSRMFQGAEEMARITHSISGAKVPSPLMPSEISSRLGCRHAAVMSTVAKHKHRLGPLAWPATHYRPEQNWHDAEAALLSPIINPLTTQESKANGK